MRCSGRAYSPFAGDGVYLMVEPFPVGKHTIHFHGSNSFGGGFTLDITYHITVTP